MDLHSLGNRFHRSHSMLLSVGTIASLSKIGAAWFYFGLMPEHETTVRSRELGEGLRRVLEKAGLTTGKEVARQLEWSQSDVSRMLTGKRAVKETDLALFLGICKVKTAERRRLLNLCREANKPGWYQQHGSRLPKQLRTYIDHEDKAVVINDYQSTLLSGSLQTGDYARAVITRIVNVPADEVDDRIAARLARSSIFSRPRPPRYTFFVHEFVLRLPVGGAAVMSEQLHHLLRMSVRSSISLRVIPMDIGAHAALAGSFTFMEFTDTRPVIYMESETSNVFLEEPNEITAYRHIVAALAETALDEAQSRDLIGRLAIELYQDPRGS
ncbi:helix-turn-helix domain-containing protein [Amycolatopsis sp. H20-H5]|uniref:helix-turn-helix domain-containing protein n=1 Tax=Amycolatopsis sp. H20-H5 TaxID=3046309 RepID=UPI002DB77487|nr:helix-turn-helix transcriptional regulator [Amycolatopsis sp. H20-H5]MEC3977783.1 helix-turn-helix transcriptional regulator [Amycolatopsis sp. H20-H5]